MKVKTYIGLLSAGSLGGAFLLVFLVGGCLPRMPSLIENLKKKVEIEQVQRSIEMY